MATDIVQGLFGMTPESYQMQQQAAAREQAMQFANMDPFQRAAYGTFLGGNMLGGAIGGALGAQDPMLQRATAIRSLAQGIDITSAKGLEEYANRLQQNGLSAEAAQLGQAIAARKQQEAQLSKTTAEAARGTLTAEREDKLQQELAKLPENATEEQTMAVLRKYGDPKTVLMSMEASQRKKMDIEARTSDLKLRLEAQIAAAEQAGATRLQIAEMQVQARKEIAALAAALKGPSAAVLKAQERADKIAEGKEGLENTLGTASKLINDISNLGGMTSTSSAPLANLITSLGTSAVGQFASGLVGTETQAKRDELGSIRLQLLNAVKEATGMSSQQLNSNVELQTWLKSLGSASMTKEANLAILNNISNRYLKKDIIPPAPPAPTPTPKTTGKPVSWNSLP